MQKRSEKLSDWYVAIYFPIFKWLIWFITFLLVVAVIVNIIIVFTQSNPLLGRMVLVVESESMLPKLKRNEVIVITSAQNYEVGDIITYQVQKDKKSITHRIVEEGFNEGIKFFRTKGDNNEYIDPHYVKEGDIMGKYDSSLGDWGSTVIFSRSVEGIVFFIIIPTTILLTVYFSDFYKKISERHQQLKQQV